MKEGWGCVEGQVELEDSEGGVDEAMVSGVAGVVFQRRSRVSLQQRMQHVKPRI